MTALSTSEELLNLVRKSGVVDERRLDTFLSKQAACLAAEPVETAKRLVQEGLLTHFQAEQLLEGKWRRFTIGNYRVLERIGTGGMSSVFLCEHKRMRRRAAVKVLPLSLAADPSALDRFYREARAVAALDHPNIVRAYDIDQDDDLHFLVMEYVDGASLQDMVKKCGPMEPGRAAQYISQAALGLQYVHESVGLVHRDVKPGNLVVDRNGVLKILDLGLARFFEDEADALTRKYEENVLGTADYIAPEQVLDSHGVDIRADIYSLGVTFYFLLAGKPPFAEGTVSQKLIWHQTRQPKALRTMRQDVPEGMEAIIRKMMAKDPDARYQTPRELVEALAPWTQTLVAPPRTAELPLLSPAARALVEDKSASTPPPSSADPASPPRKEWQVERHVANPKPALPGQGLPGRKIGEATVDTERVSARADTVRILEREAKRAKEARDRAIAMRRNAARRYWMLAGGAAAVVLLGLLFWWLLK